MHRRKKTVSSVVILAVVLVLFMGARARQDDEVANAPLQVGGARYSGPGSYLVGTRELMIEGERQLGVLSGIRR